MIAKLSQTFTNALYYLAAYPEYAKPLREEIESVVSEEGWGKVAMGRMRKLDSFLREAQRHSGGVGGRVCFIALQPVNLTWTVSSLNEP